MTHVSEYADRDARYLQALRKRAAELGVTMYVVDYLGRFSTNGLISRRSSLYARFAIRSAAHVQVYGLTVVEFGDTYVEFDAT